MNLTVVFTTLATLKMIDLIDWLKYCRFYLKDAGLFCWVITRVMADKYSKMCIVLLAAYAKQLDASIMKRIDALTKLHGNTGRSSFSHSQYLRWTNALHISRVYVSASPVVFSPQISCHRWSVQYLSGGDLNPLRKNGRHPDEVQK